MAGMVINGFVVLSDNLVYVCTAIPTKEIGPARAVNTCWKVYLKVINYTYSAKNVNFGFQCSMCISLTKDLSAYRLETGCNSIAGRKIGNIINACQALLLP